jgi:fatty acid desaturase
LLASWLSGEDDEHSEKPSTRQITENVEKIQELIYEDCHWTIHELNNTTSISYGVRQEILTENLNMHHIAPSS